MSTTLYWTKPGYYSGYVVGDSCSVERVANSTMTLHEANEKARSLNRGTPTLIETFEDAFRYGDYVIFKGKVYTRPKEAK